MHLHGRLHLRSNPPLTRNSFRWRVQCGNCGQWLGTFNMDITIQDECSNGHSTESFTLCSTAYVLFETDKIHKWKFVPIKDIALDRSSWTAPVASSRNHTPWRRNIRHLQSSIDETTNVRLHIGPTLCKTTRHTEYWNTAEKRSHLFELCEHS